jgi:hypothetical protein
MMPAAFQFIAGAIPIPVVDGNDGRATDVATVVTVVAVFTAVAAVGALCAGLFFYYLTP